MRQFSSRTMRIFSVALLAGLSVASPGLADGTVWTTIRVVFGPEARDITEEVDWFRSDIGIVEEENYSSVTEALVGYDFAQEFDGYGPLENEFADLAGDIGMELELPPTEVLHRVMVEPGTTEIVVDLSDRARVLLEAEALSGDDIVGIEIRNDSTMMGSRSAWGHAGVPQYLVPGDYSVTLRVADRDLSETLEVSLSAGEEVTLSFTFED